MQPGYCHHGMLAGWHGQIEDLPVSIAYSARPNPHVRRDVPMRLVRARFRTSLASRRDGMNVAQRETLGSRGRHVRLSPGGTIAGSVVPPGLDMLSRVPHRFSGGGLIRTPGDVGSCRDTEWLIRPPALKGVVKLPG